MTRPKAKPSRAERNTYFLRHGRLTRDDEKELRREFRDRYYDAVLAAHFGERSRATSRYRNVLGYGIGEKMTSDKYTGDAALVVYVKKKSPPSRVKSTRVPESLGGIPTDVVEVGGDFVALSSSPPCGNPASRQPRPFPAGVSVGGDDNAAGSIGYRVARQDIPGQLVLSNFHVLGGQNTPVFQPGFGDNMNRQTDQIGVVVGAVPLLFDGQPNSMDAAVARVNAGVCLPAICDFGRLTAAEDPRPAESVRIFGKTTHHALGFVRGIVADITISFGARNARFVDQLVIERDPQSPSPVIAAGGDSGSVVIKAPATACALLFAAVTTGAFALATPIERIFTRFRIGLVT